MDDTQIPTEFWLQQLEAATFEKVRLEGELKAQTNLIEEAIFELFYCTELTVKDIARASARTPRQVYAVRDKIGAERFKQDILSRQHDSTLDEPEFPAHWGKPPD